MLLLTADGIEKIYTQLVDQRLAEKCELPIFLRQKVACSWLRTTGANPPAVFQNLWRKVFWGEGFP